MPKPNIAVITATDAPELARALPCGCRLPFDLCPVAQDLLEVEAAASTALTQLWITRSSSVEAAHQALTNWRAAHRAYNVHTRTEPV